MTNELKPEVIKKTQESLGKFIKKPVLTEKLLSKPPFRFLHDICTAVMRETGFFDTVLSPSDCQADNIKDKDGKIAFLQKVIAAVEAANSTKLLVKPSQVVAGHEPARTNEFLQALAKALEKQTGKNKTVTKTKPEPNEAKPTKVKVSSKKGSKGNEKEEPLPVKKKPGSTTKADKIDSKVLLESRPRHDKLSKEKKNENSPRKNRENSIDKDLTEEEKTEKMNKTRERSKLKASQMTSNDSSEIYNENKTSKEEETPEGAVEVVKMEVEQTGSKRPVSAKPGHRRPPTISENSEATCDTVPSPTKESEPPVRNASETAPKRPDSSFTKLNRRNSTSGSGPPSYVTKDDGTEEVSPISRPLTGFRPTTSRPASARPAAPRIRDRGEITIHEDVVKQNMGNVQIITDMKDGNEVDEDENVVVVEPESDILDDELHRTNKLDSKDEETTNQGEHGLLVEQILETQKEMDQTRLQIMENKISGKTEIDWKSSRNRDATDREMKKLRLSIQTLTRSANPLGKLLSFLQEDVDIMQKELNSWKEMNVNLDQEIDQERSLTEQSVEPLKVYLKEIQQSIDQELEQMLIVKANILKNDQKIYKLLTDMK